MGGLSQKNLEIIKNNFHFIEVDEISEGAVTEIGKRLGLEFNPDEISVKSDWKKFKKYFVFDKDEKRLLFIKDIWETNGFKEVIALHMAKHIFEPELVAEDYVFGFHYGRAFSKKPQPFLATTFVPGEPLKKRGWEPHAFELGRQFYLHQVLSLYDCELRHFLIHNDKVRRIDLGLGFYHLTNRYRGFEEYMPKGLPYMRKFWRGYDFEEGKIKVMILNTRDELKRLLDELYELVEDDLIDFRPKRFVRRLERYWDVERLPILDFPSHNKEPNEDPDV